MKTKNMYHCCFLIGAVALIPTALPAASITWANTSGASWSSTSAWTGGVVPGSGDMALFGSSAPQVVKLSGTQSASGINLSGGGWTTTYTLQSTAATVRTLNLGTGGVLNDTNNPFASTFDATLKIVLAGTVSSTTSLATVANGPPDDLMTPVLSFASEVNGGTGAKILSLDGESNNTVSGAITDGTGALQVKVRGFGYFGGPGWVLTGNNTYTGGTAVLLGGLGTAGYLGIGNGGTTGSIGTGALSINDGGLVQVNRSNAFTLGMVISGTNGELEQIGAGTTTISGSSANTFSGQTTVTAGSLNLRKTTGNAVAGNLVIDGGTVNRSYTGYTADQIADTANITVTSGTLTGPTAVDTVNNVTISSTTPFGSDLGNLTIGGTLTIDTAVAAGSSQDIRIANSGTTTTANAVSLSGGTKGTLSAQSGNSTFTVGSGGFTFAGATLQFGNGAGTGGLTAKLNLNGNVSASGTNVFSIGTATNTNLIDLGGSTRTFDVSSGTTTVAPVIQNGGITKSGSGVLVLSATNTYTGNTTVNAGRLQLDTASLANASTVSIASGAELKLNHAGTDAIGALVLAGVTQASGTWGAIGSGAAHQTSAITGTGLLQVP